MSAMLMKTLEQNSRDFGAINERLWNRLPNSSGYAHHLGQPSLPSDDDRRHQSVSPGASEATAPAYTTTSTSPGREPTPQRQPPQPLLSLFSEDGSDDDEPGGDHHLIRRGLFDDRGSNSRRGWGGAHPPPSRGPSLRPWEWPDICRGTATGPPAPLRGTDQEELECFTPHGERTISTRRVPDERPSGPPASLEGRRWGEQGETGTESARPDGLPERRSIYGGLEHVKKRLWGSMFEAAGASIKRRVDPDGGLHGDKPDKALRGNGDGMDEEEDNNSAGALTHNPRRKQQRRATTAGGAVAAAVLRGKAGQSGVDHRGPQSTHRHRFPPLLRATASRTGGLPADGFNGTGKGTGEGSGRGNKDAGGGGRKSGEDARGSFADSNGRSRIDGAGGIDGISSSGDRVDPGLGEGGASVRGRHTGDGGGHKDPQDTGRENSREGKAGDGGSGMNTPRNVGAGRSDGRDVRGVSPMEPRRAGPERSDGARDQFPPLPGAKKKKKKKNATRNVKEKGGSDVPYSHPLRSDHTQGNLRPHQSSRSRHGVSIGVSTVFGDGDRDGDDDGADAGGEISPFWRGGPRWKGYGEERTVGIRG